MSNIRGIEKENKAELVKCIVYVNPWEAKRKEILSLFINSDKNPRNYSKAIDICYTMIQANRDQLGKLFNDLQLIRYLKTTSVKNLEYYKQVTNFYKLLEDYMCNIMLLIYGFMMSK
jgi:hypothetical protein